MARQPISSLFLFYTLARFAIFAVIALLLFWVGFTGWPGLITAALVSIPISYFALRSVRDKLTARIAARQAERIAVREDFRTAGTDAETDRPSP